MIIELKKVGKLLILKNGGHEAYLALQPNLRNIDIKNKVIIDFDKVEVFIPSWGDEFLIPLLSKFRENLFLKNTKNPSVKVTLDILEETNKINFNRIK